MEYQLAFPSDLGLGPEEFVTAWNATPDRCTIADIRLAPSSGAATYDPLLVAGVITVISTVATGVLTNVLPEQIKQLLTKKGSQKHTEIVELEQPDGSRMLGVTTDEGE